MTRQFSDFYSSLDADPAKRGRQFEHFVKWFLKADPEWSTQVDQVWLWDEWPERWGIDCGVDLVFRHKNGEYWAVQAKCYAPNKHITKHDIDKFLSESNRKAIHHRLLIATTDLISENAKQVCEAQEKSVVRFLLSDLERSALEYPDNITSLAYARRKAQPIPRDHQIEAISAVVEGLHTADRGQLVMACGTGKTYVALWVKERLGAKRTLVLVPSLGLLSQILHEWTFAATDPFEVLCVCSDQTVAARGQDETIRSISDLAFPVTSNTSEVRSFLCGMGNRVVFATYQSSTVIAAAQADKGAPAFDLTVADEAHRCAGRVSREFSLVLDKERIRSSKRIFATATPRTYTRKVRKVAKERGGDVVGMDNPEYFGEVLYALPFSSAIERKLLTDYRVVIIGVDDPTIAKYIAKRELVTTGTGIETDSETLAAQIGLLKAIKDYDLKSVITFHSRVVRAREFAGDIQNVMQWVVGEHRPSGTLRSDYVSGDMPAIKRKLKIDQLKTLANDERCVLSNARCLSEGVDVPSLDGVAFIDPRSSQLDIIQAVGRAIRLSPNKDIGTIVLPVFIEDGESAGSSIEASNFEPIWDVLNALRAHDDILTDELDQIRTELGKRHNGNFRVRGLQKIKIDLPVTVDSEFGSALRTYLVQQVTNPSWDFWFELLKAHIENVGNARVQRDYKTEDGYNLGSWVAWQRRRKDKLPRDRISRLEALPGWSWNLHDDNWEYGFNCLKKYVKRRGNCLIPSSYRTADGFSLGSWVGLQRQRKKHLTQKRVKRLESLSGWTWDTNKYKWDEGYRYLLEYVADNGYSSVPYYYQTADGFQLGQWVGVQRGLKIKGHLKPERIAGLEALPQWKWRVLEDKWEMGFRHLIEYVKNEGDAKCSSQYFAEDGYPLGQWVAQQRRMKSSLSPERKSRMDGIPGWRWDPRSDMWEEGFHYLKEFVVREGHAKVPQLFKADDGYSLGRWVNNQRRFMDKLSPERKAQLEELPGWVWHAVSRRQSTSS